MASLSGIGGLIKACARMLADLHAELRTLMDEADPRTTSRLLDRWEEVYGLPLCADAPADDDSRRAALAGRVAAQGGQSRAYFIDLAWAVLEADGEFVRADDPEGVWIDERPYGDPFVAWGGEAWDVLGGRGAPFYWTMHLPSAVSTEKRAIIECLLCKYKPAHTVLLRLNDLRHYYSTPGGASDYAAASTNVAARILFPGGPIGTFTVLMWVKQDTGAGIDLWSCGTSGADVVSAFADGARTDQVVDLLDGGASVDAFMLSLPDSDAWVCYAVSCDGSTLRGYSSGALDSSGSASGTYTAQDAFVLFARGGTVPVVAGAETGSLRNIAIFDRALTADEIAALYDAGMHHNYANRHGADWAGETPVVYWRTKPVAGAVPNSGSGGVCALTLGGDVTATEEEAEITCETPGEPDPPTALGTYYHFPGSGTDDTAIADIGAIEHQTIMFWMRVTAADEGGDLLLVQNDYGETYEVYLAAGGDFILELTVSNALYDGTSGASAARAYAAWDFYSVEVDPADGIGRMYRNGVEILETAGTPLEGGESPGGFGGSITFQGINLNNVDVANIKTMNRVLTSAERTSLYAAGKQHDYRVATGDWAGDTGGIYWRDADVAGTVENIGTAGTADLVLAGDTTSEAF